MIPGAGCSHPFETLEARWHLSVSQDPDGWTIVTPEADTHVIYVSSSEGSDSNTGRAPDRPVKSLAKGISLLRDNSSDQVLLKRGDVWRETLGAWRKSGKSEDAPILIGAYGDGDRPRLDTGPETAFAVVNGTRPIRHLSIIGIHFAAHTRLPGSTFVSASGEAGLRMLAPVDNLLIEDCLVRGYRDNILLQNFSGPITDVTIRRSVILDAYGEGSSHAQGVYAQGVDGLLIEENIFDHNGWMEGVSGGGRRTGFNHNAYLRADNKNVVVRGNVFAHASSHGLQARAGGIIENNLFIENPIGMSFGLVNGSPATPGGVSGAVNGNVFIGGDDLQLGGEPRGWGLDIGNIRAGAATVISNNIFSGGGDGESPAIQLSVGDNIENYSQTVGINDLTIRGNVIYGWAEGIRVGGSLDPGITGPKALNGLVIRENDFQRIRNRAVLHDMRFDGNDETWSGNRYDGGGDGRPEISMGHRDISWERWRNDYESSAVLTTVDYDQPTRTPGTLNALLGGEATTEAFVAELRQNSSVNRRPQYTATAVIAHVRAGFAEQGEAPQPETPIGEPPPPPEPPPPGNPPPPPPVNPEPPPIPRDWSPPVAPVATTDLAPQVRLNIGEQALTFSVTYIDSDASLDLASIDSDDLRVVGRRFEQPASLIALEQVSENTAVATYAVSRPEGVWRSAHRGTYTVFANPEQVRDIDGLAVESAALAEFTLTVSKPPPPDHPPIVRKVKLSSRGASSVTAWFNEDVSASIDATDLVLLAEDGSRVDPSLVSVTYNPAKKCATWTFPGLPDGKLPRGRYRIVLTAAGITDSIGQPLDGNRDRIGGDDYDRAKRFRA